MKNTFIYPYKAGSDSAKELAIALGVKRIAHKNTKFQGDADKWVINWGASTIPQEVSKCRVLNRPEAVAIASDKIKFFFSEDVRDSGLCVPATTDKQEAIFWCNEGCTVVERHEVKGKGGEGIVMCDDSGQLGDAPLYTMYIKKKSEFRVHVVDGEVIDVQRKVRRLDVPDDKVNWQVRNYENGFAFARNEALGNVPNSVLRYATAIVGAIGLDFGAVDVVYSDKKRRPYVLEVNTAPGLAGETIYKYAMAFQILLA